MSNLLDVFFRILANNRNKEERRCWARVQQAEDKMKQHPISELTWCKERARRLAEWDAKQQEKSEQWAERIKVKGLEVYDRMSKESFQKLAPARTDPSMKELKHPFELDEQVATLPEDVCRYATLYYRDILTSRRQGEGADTDLSQHSDHWQNTTVRLSRQGRLDLDRRVTKEEAAEEALKVMASGKTPGEDGLPVDFYRKHWEVVGEDLVEIYNEIQMGVRLPTTACRGIISILFKKGDTNEIRNWRPISLLNVSYKILAKVLARRLGRHLPNLVEDDQAAFRSIYDNIVTAIETLEVVSKEELDVAVLLLDMEKAYYQVNWSFVLTSLRWIGFGDMFCSWVVALYSLSTASVMVNGHISAQFQLSRSLRRGCPLAPSLFVVHLEIPLSNIRNHAQIVGIDLGGHACKVKALADDLFAVSANLKESMSALHYCLQQYEELSEAAINWSKSVFFRL
ncbi:hypothetical protein CBR_g24222 [Chara braunii]|uniref:Reverse transcriptase domain-containing protein n=1 Tax=Chara braunii TaxID=69332 RepID=A0A388L641_CHABU|nr:hypothetical protein CBR_g24222 [Chara braunii]|eukprot:GBG77775.1 hypothetical protein CBR_g24222 [Chara braunii]